MKSSKNVILIGMPGSGKSTVGVVLAKGIGLLFVKLAKWVSGRSKRFGKGGRIHEKMD